VATDEVFYKGQGCDPCNGLGYRGRTAVYELLQMTPALRQTVSSTSNSDTIQQLAIEAGMQTLTTHALSLARSKLIALGEVNRIRIE
jgi:type IV pilus assembly protein PilB